MEAYTSQLLNSSPCGQIEKVRHLCNHLVFVTTPGSYVVTTQARYFLLGTHCVVATNSNGIRSKYSSSLKRVLHKVEYYLSYNYWSRLVAVGVWVGTGTVLLVCVCVCV